jgi:ABC-type transport system involved in multi-copper enzyme maturation permease subunit
MGPINPKSIYCVAKKEFLDNIRNKWIIILTTLLFLLVVLFSYLAGAGGGLGDMEGTVVGLVGISSMIIPLIAIILGFSTISGEAESGSFSVVLSYPVTRLEVLLGKFLGLGSVIVVAVLIGFGFGGVIITVTTGGESWLGYLGFMGLTMLLGFVFLSLSICVSSFFKKRITSIGGGLIIFFWGMIIGSVFMGILYASGYGITDMMAGNIPDWYWGEAFFSPADLNQAAVMRAFGINEINMMGSGSEGFKLPDFLNLGTAVLVHLIWLIIPMILAYFFFKRRDI